MARGWESKSIESQIEAAEERQTQARAARLSAEQVQLQRERESLELSRTRVLQDLARATHAGYRVQLERSLEYLEAKLKELTESTGGSAGAAAFGGENSSKSDRRA
jgi:septation ring formation regulator EzrA